MKEPEQLNEWVTLYEGDCLEVMKSLPENSIGSIVTDPPYGLGKEPDALAMLRDWFTDGHHDVKGKGFMGKEWDAFVPQPATWKECLRVLKPGGHLLSFGGTRTYDLVVMGLRIAGFELRDCVMWSYGSGFPKSMDVSKAIDKEAGAKRECTRDGVVERNGYGDDWDTGSSSSRPRYDNPATPAAREWSGWGTALKPAYEPCAVCRKPVDGTVAENVLKWGTGAVNVDGCRVGTEVESWPASRAYSRHDTGNPVKVAAQPTGTPPPGRWPANLIHDGSEEVVSLFPQSRSPSGVQKPGVGALGLMNDDEWKPKRREFIGAGDSGSAARFFYCAKASKSERGKANNHPTVKPLALMQYLIRLVTHKSQTVLDPYGGSGTTAIAAMREGVKCIVIERDPAYCQIIRDRVRAESRNPVGKSTETKPTVHKEEKTTSPTLFDGFAS